VETRSSDSQSPLGKNLTSDLLEITFKGIRFLELMDIFAGGDGLDFTPSDEIVHEILKMLNRTNDDVGDVFEFEKVFFGDEKFFSSFPFGGEDAGEESVDPFYAAIQS